MTGRTILRCMMAGLLALTLSACSDDDSDNGSTTSPSPAAQSTTAQSTTTATSAATTAAATSAATSAPSGRAATAAATSAASGTTTPAGGATAAQPLAVRAGEQGDAFFYDPKDVTVRAGRVALSFNNVGPQRRHTWVVRTSSGQEIFKSNEVEPNTTQTAEFTIQAGTYEVLCTLPGHANRGQRGTLTVTN